MRGAHEGGIDGGAPCGCDGPDRGPNQGLTVAQCAHRARTDDRSDGPVGDDVELEDAGAERQGCGVAGQGAHTNAARREHGYRKRRGVQAGRKQDEEAHRRPGQVADREGIEADGRPQADRDDERHQWVRER